MRLSHIQLWLFKEDKIKNVRESERETRNATQGDDDDDGEEEAKSQARLI